MNTGKPIPKEEIPLVWNRYYTKNKNHKRNVVGTGLGLSIVKIFLIFSKFIKFLIIHNITYPIYLLYN